MAPQMYTKQGSAISQTRVLSPWFESNFWPSQNDKTVFFNFLFSFLLFTYIFLVFLVVHYPILAPHFFYILALVILSLSFCTFWTLPFNFFTACCIFCHFWPLIYHFTMYFRVPSQPSVSTYYLICLCSPYFFQFEIPKMSICTHHVSTSCMICVFWTQILPFPDPYFSCFTLVSMHIFLIWSFPHPICHLFQSASSFCLNCLFWLQILLFPCRISPFCLHISLCLFWPLIFRYCLHIMPGLPPGVAFSGSIFIHICTTRGHHMLELYLPFIAQ